MASSSRIIGAEDVTDVRQFKLDELRSSAGGAGLASRLRGREEEGPPPGYKDGFKRGLEEGMRRGAEAARQQLQREQGERLQAIADEFAQRTAALHEGMEAAFAQVRDEVAAQTISLALELARQVIRGQLRTDPRAIEPVVREAIACLIDERASFTVHLNPDDAELLGPVIEPVMQPRGAQLIADPSIAAGGCLITSAGAEVDATLNTRWHRVLASIGQPPSAVLAIDAADEPDLQDDTGSTP
ncbi:MAG TPA: FliH/SctL family protein [Burkholderiaceae bacterium]|jgi:flagellar assembly protein FliH|nr:FliH/SctL family protein [Burkholderiaceae bacterium]